MAKSVKSSLTNILVWVLMAMLVFGLAGFGVTSFGGNIRSVATVGETVVDANAYGRALEQQLNTLRQQSQSDLTFAEAEQLGLTQSVLQQRVALAALEEAARQAAISIGDEEVARRIQAIPAFQGPDGAFSRDTYDFVLQRSGMTPEVFEESVRREGASALVRGALVTGLSVPTTYVDTMYRFFTEERSVAFATLNADMLDPAPAAPSEEEIAAFYDENSALFTTPETKDIRYVWLSPEMLLDEVALSDAELRAYYDANSDRYNRPEQRMVTRLGFGDMEAAAAAMAALEAGEASFEDLLNERGLSEADVDMGAVTQSDLNAGAAEAVFALEDTGLAGPVESSVGPAIFRVNAIFSASQTSFEEALPELRAELARSEAERLVVEEIETLDDLLAGGATLEELAAETPVELGDVAWTSEAPGDTAPLSLPEFALAAEALAQGDFPEILTASDGSLFALELTGITPAQVQPLESVRDEATEGAAAAKTVAALRDLGEDFLNKLENGESFAALDLPTETRDGITRQRPALELPLPVLSEVYELGADEYALVAGEEEVYLLHVTRITQPPMDTPEAETARARLTQDTNLTMVDEMLAQFANAIANEAGVHYDQTALNAVHTALR